MRRVLVAFALVAVVTAVVAILTRPAPAPVDTTPHPGSYGNLTAAQRRLVDDWVGRLATAAGQPVEPQKLYDDLALSTRTTFTAVTHALSSVHLEGEPAGSTALDLVAAIDTVAGSAPGKGGDKQFRIYVQMKPGAKAALDKSGTFKRQVDNTVYHKGYPTCFRATGGTPSIQVSMARDERHGDIDVDYRASTFPVMLINGHLTASNSDVRAGNNVDRHNQRWSGLQNWWQGFMGVPALEAPREEAAILANKTMNEPRLGKGTKPEDAVFDFLHAWLVEASPGIAAGYVAPRAFSCLELERGEAVDRGVARVQIARALYSVSHVVGNPPALDGIVQGVSLSGPRGKEVTQAHRELFAMYELRDDLASEFDCENRLHPEQADQEAMNSTAFSGYVGAVFRVQASGVRGEVVATVWKQDKGVWQLVGYDVEPEIRRTTLTADAAPIETTAPAAVRGDPAMTRAAKAFLDDWFVKKDTDAAFQFLSPESYACYNAFKSDDQPLAGSSAEAGGFIKARMNEVADWIGSPTQLEDVLAGADAHHPEVSPVPSESSAFSIVALPDDFGAALTCASLAAGESPKSGTTAPPAYGRYYAASSRLKRAGPDAAVLWTLWTKQTNAWKIVSYLVMAP